MRIRSFHSILDDCLDAMQRGESVDGCLSRYPRQADRLRPLLQLAERVRRTRPVTPRPWAQATSWNLVRRHASDMRAGKRRHLTDAGHGIGWVRPAAVAAALLAALALGTGGTALAAQNALPNSPLYRVKLATEDVRLWFVFDDKHKADILLAQSNERTSEILAMVSKGEPVPENVLSTLSDRNGRAAEILAGQSDAGELSEKLRYQTEAQERLLLALWPDVEESAQGEYAQAVADIHNIRLSRGGALVAAVDPEELSAGVVNISGVAQKVSDGAWSVGGVEVRIDDKTIDSSQLESGVTGDFIVARSSNGRLHVLSFTNVKPDQSPAQAV
ncbi:MAG: hypothetical protein E6J42_05010, partial [Chloroflexi bacterium]